MQSNGNLRGAHRQTAQINCTVCHWQKVFAFLQCGKTDKHRKQTALFAIGRKSLPFCDAEDTDKQRKLIALFVIGRKSLPFCDAVK